MADARARKAATIYDVAREAGVSSQTVSRLLTGYMGIRPQTREKVLQAIALLDYKPNMAARSLATSRSHRLGLVTHEIDEVGPSRIMQGAAAAARQAGYLVDIVTLDTTDNMAVRDGLDLVAAQSVAGILALSSTDEMRDAFKLANFTVPAYFGSEADEDPELRDIPEERGLVNVVNHLADLGHTCLAYVGGPSGWAAARNRLRTFNWAIARRHLQPVHYFDGDWSSKSGYAAGMDVPIEHGVTAVVAANDQMALGVILALVERGFDVPSEVSVTGMDDIPEAAFMRPPLTTIRIDFGSQGRDSVEQLLARIENRDPRPRSQRDPELVIRQSTGPARLS